MPVRSGMIDIETLPNHCRNVVRFRKLMRATHGLVEPIEEYLQQGYSVQLDDLGIFTVSASSDGFDNAEDCTPSKVHARKICFRADKNF